MAASEDGAVTQYGAAYWTAVQKDMGTGARLTMLEFLNLPNLPTYYKVLVNIVLAGPNTSEKTPGTFEQSRQYLYAAEKALNEAKKIYVYDDDDAGCIEEHKKMILEEWDAVDRKEKKWRAQSVISSAATLEGKPTLETEFLEYDVECQAASRTRPFEEAPYKMHRTVTYFESLIKDPKTPPIFKMIAHLNRSMWERAFGDRTDFLKEAKAHI